MASFRSAVWHSTLTKKTLSIFMCITKKLVKNAVIYFLFILISICIAYRMFVAYEMHCTPDRTLSGISHGDIVYQYNYHQYVIVFTCDNAGNIFCHILKRSSISNLDWYTLVKSEGSQNPWPNPDAGRDEQLPVYLTMTLFPSADDYRTTQPLYLYYGEIFGEAVESFTINGMPCDLGIPSWPESVTTHFPSSAKTKLFILIAPEISWPPSYSINDRCSG